MSATKGRHRFYYSFFFVLFDDSFSICFLRITKRAIKFKRLGWFEIFRLLLLLPISREKDFQGKSGRVGYDFGYREIEFVNKKKRNEDRDELVIDFDGMKFIETWNINGKRAVVNWYRSCTCIYKFVTHMKKNFPTIFIQYNKFNFYTD